MNFFSNYNSKEFFRKITYIQNKFYPNKAKMKRIAYLSLLFNYGCSEDLIFNLKSIVLGKIVN